MFTEAGKYWNLGKQFSAPKSKLATYSIKKVYQENSLAKLLGSKIINIVPLRRKGAWHKTSKQDFTLAGHNN
jgi:hypothetical protein